MENTLTCSRLEKSTDNFIEGIGNTLSGWGISKVAAQVFTYLQTQNQPVSLNQIVEDLKISKGNISINIRLLEELEAVKKIWIKGDRRDFYESSIDLSTFVAKLLSKKIKNDINSSLTCLNGTISLLQENISQCSREESDRARFIMQKLQGERSLYSTLHQISREIEEYEFRLDHSKLRSIWNTLKSQLKKRG